MPSYTFKLHIYYRHVHMKHEGRSRDPNKQRPEWFDYEKCFSNLLQTLDDSPLASCVTLTVIYDGTLPEFAHDFMHKHCEIPRRYPFCVKTVEAGSNHNSWLVALDQAGSVPMENTDLIYFIENDYLHLPGWLEKVYELCASGIQFDYLSLYDHMDKYILQMYGGLTSKLFVTASHHWRTAPNTCGTFLLRRSTLLEDTALWAMEIQDYFVFTELCQNRGRILLTPTPGLATHSMHGYLSPTIDWASV
jgi:hypothetical protein